MSDDMISRKAAVAAAIKVAEEAKSYRLPAMSLGAMKVADELKVLPPALQSSVVSVSEATTVGDKLSLRDYLSRHFESLMGNQLLSAKLERVFDEIEIPDCDAPAGPLRLLREPSGRLVLTLVIEE